MATYELTIITAGDDDIAAAGKIVEDTQKILKEAKASIKQEHQWGRRPLAYDIRKQNHGYYTTFEFEVEPTLVASIERAIRLHGKVMRWLTTEAFDEPSSLAAPTSAAAIDDETRGAEELLRRGSGEAPKRPTKKKVVKVESAEDESERQQQVEEALSKILEDEPEKK